MASKWAEDLRKYGRKYGFKVDMYQDGNREELAFYRRGYDTTGAIASASRSKVTEERVFAIERHFPHKRLVKEDTLKRFLREYAKDSRF